MVPKVEVFEIVPTQDGKRRVRLLKIRCPFCKTHVRGRRGVPAHDVPTVHIHGGGFEGEALRGYGGGRCSHCIDGPGGEYDLIIPEALIQQFGSEEERAALRPDSIQQGGVNK